MSGVAASGPFHQTPVVGILGWMSHAFYRTAVEFCTWAGSQSGVPSDNISTALLRLGDLYVAGLNLPSDPEPGEDVDEPDPTSHPKWGGAVGHFASLPFSYYWMVFAPHDEPDDEPVCGDLNDDLRDVFKDVATGILLWEDGHTVEAVWHWRFHFNDHWGRHVVSALAAMHTWAADHGGWSS